MDMKTFRAVAILLASLAFAGPAVAQDTAESAIDVRTATVTEMQIAGSYVYLRVMEGDKEVWLATSPGFIKDISYGDVVEFYSEVEMQDFHSKGLDRTFDSIWFISRIRVKPEETAEDSVAEATAQ
jgi:hypothetical protein